MASEAPALLPTLVIASDAYLAAELSCPLAKRGAYLPILEAPRMLRPDADAEVLRCNNSAARMQPTKVILAGANQGTVAAFSGKFPDKRTHPLDALSGLPAVGVSHMRNLEGILTWGRKRIGLGVLRALRERRQIVFHDSGESPESPVASESGHLVVYEEGNNLSEVIAANYAYALGAGLAVIPEVPKEDSERILESFYEVYEHRDRPATQTLQALKDELRLRSGGLRADGYRTITFIAKELPWGFAFPECPTTHLFSYPDLGKLVLSGILAELPEAPGIRVAMLIDPSEKQSKDISFAIDALRHRGVFVRGVGGAGASVYRVSRSIELYPYDFLLISTHCGDAPGWRWTYEFRDRDGRDRILVVDIAIHVTGVPMEEKLEVRQYVRFVSLDGVDWNDPNKNAKLVVGNAMHDYLERVRDPERMIPTKRETVARVVGSAALQMANGNYLPMPVSIADEGTPIVLNNACASWHRLAGTFTFGNARAYIGTLFPVTEFEAQDIADRLLNRHFGKPLAVALWHAQNEIFGDATRRPYALVGTHFQSLRTTQVDAPAFILSRLEQSLRNRSQKVQKEANLSEGEERSMKDYRRFLAAEIRHIKERWLK